MSKTRRKSFTEWKTRSFVTPDQESSLNLQSVVLGISLKKYTMKAIEWSGPRGEYSFKLCQFNLKNILSLHLSKNYSRVTIWSICWERFVVLFLARINSSPNLRFVQSSIDKKMLSNTVDKEQRISPETDTLFKTV